MKTKLFEILNHKYFWPAMAVGCLLIALLATKAEEECFPYEGVTSLDKAIVSDSKGVRWLPICD